MCFVLIRLLKFYFKVIMCLETLVDYKKLEFTSYPKPNKNKEFRETDKMMHFKSFSFLRKYKTVC